MGVPHPAGSTMGMAWLERTRVLRDLEQHAEEQPDTPRLLLQAIRELLMEAEAEAPNAADAA
jgi:hypothetical protein